jgi:hypothetical protein
MTRVLLLLVLAGCGGVSGDELRACGQKAREHVALEGCEFRNSTCMEKDGHAWCEAQMDCAGTPRKLTETCLTLEM